VTKTSRRLYRPRLVEVEAAGDGVPRSVGDVAVEAVREEWLVDDRWWTGRPLRRRYFELVTAGGRDMVVFFDLARGRWYTQRA
jgi:hypothetical protein